MVNEKQTKRERNIRSKLMAAIAMLLVSSIMMVSTTYAWFTLSTAPEVTGITTNIASNGNLEIALSPESGIGSEVGDATLNTLGVVEKNKTWGNLVDMDDTSYGLDKLTLAPAALSLLADAGVYSLNPAQALATPTYGPDGRISALTPNAFIAHNTAEEGAEAKYEAPGDAGFNYGVRAVGTTSGLSPQATQLRTALSTMTTQISNAKSAVSTSLSGNGQALTAMLVKHAITDPDTNNYGEYVDELESLVTALESSVTNINEALRAYLLAVVTVEAFAADFEALSTAIKGLDMTTLTVSGTTVTINGTSVTVPEAFANAVTARDNFAEDVATARAKQNTLADTATEKNWTNASAVLYCLMNANGSAVTINDKTLAEFSAMGTSELVKYLPALMNQTVISLGKGSGLYYDLAEITGNFVASMKKVQIGTVTYGDITVENAEIEEVVIKTDVPASTTAHLPGLRSNASVLPPVSSGASQAVDADYGYVVDLMVRTNAAGTKLLLQTEDKQRVYGDSTNTATMGKGTSFTFTTTNPDHVAILQDLLGSIRVVFFDPSDSNKVMGIAKVIGDPKTDVNDAGETTVTGYLQLCKLTIVDGAVYKAGDVLSVDDQTTTEFDESDVLCDLTQNTAQPISALVYLDGFDVTSADVLADAAITGALNLQFASSATLSPMMNSDLYNGN